MILTFDSLTLQFKDYTDVKGKIRREVQSGRLTQITRGLYETDARADGKYLAGAIYGPSYLSFDYVLSMCSLIPEAIFRTYTSATFRKGKAKQYDNAFGVFTSIILAWKFGKKTVIPIRSPLPKRHCATNCTQYRPSVRSKQCGRYCSKICASMKTTFGN